MTKRNTYRRTSGADILRGSESFDTLRRGENADTLQFWTALDVGKYASATNVIADFSSAEGDRISLADIDADEPMEGDQAFTFIDTAAFSGIAGELRYTIANGTTVLAADGDGDGIANGYIVLNSEVALTAADFVL